MAKSTFRDDADPNECREFVRMLRTGKMHGTHEQPVQPVYDMDALYCSQQTGEKIDDKHVILDESHLLK